MHVGTSYQLLLTKSDYKIISYRNFIDNTKKHIQHWRKYSNDDTLEYLRKYHILDRFEKNVSYIIIISTNFKRDHLKYS